MSGLYSIGLSGLQVAQMGLMATQQNVTNANTVGYNRQQAVQTANTPLMTGQGAIGQGAHVTTIARMYDNFLSEQVNTAQSNVSELTTFYQQINQINNMMADESSGLSPSLQDFFRAVQQVAANPSSLPARQSMSTSSQVVTNRFQALEGRLAELGDQVNGRITDTVGQINNLARQVADMNQRIIVAQSAYNQPPNDLLDARDKLIGDLNKLVKVTTFPSPSGAVSVSIARGQPLVVDSTPSTLVAMQSIADPTRIVVGIQTGGGNQELPDAMVTGGVLGGLVSFRNQSLDATANDLGRIAASFALTFNAQNSLGQDLLGNISGDAGFVGNVFTLTPPKVIPGSLNTGSGAVLAVLAPPTAPTGPTYAGNFSTSLQASDYQLAFGASGAWSVTRLRDGQSVAAGSGAGTANFDGVAMKITTAGNNGDLFLLQPVRYQARNLGVDSRLVNDPRLVAAAAPVKVNPSLSNQGTMKIDQGVIGQGYDASGLPLTLTASATALSGLPVLAAPLAGATAVYSDGSSVAVTGGSANLANGAATLAGVSFNGMYFSLTGAPAAGDTFVIARNNSGVQDSRNAVLLGKLATQNTTGNGAASYQGAYAQMVANNGIATQEAKVKSDAQQSLLTQSTAVRNAYSGVNLDEEATNLLKFQQAYQAAAKSLQIAGALFDSILALGR